MIRNQDAIHTLAGQKRSGLWCAIGNEFCKNRNWYIFILPGIIFYIAFKYLPLYFLQAAFRDYRITRDLYECQWVGLKYFYQLFSSVGFLNALKNTLILSFMKLAFSWPVPIILALFLNEIVNMKFKRAVQTIIYLPHFISWVIIGGIIINFLSVNGGLVNQLTALLGLEPVSFLTKKEYFRPILVLSDIWKSAGWGTIIYLATMSKIAPEIYESANIDGATRIQKMRYITVPGIKDVIIVLLILRLGNLLNVGFEQVLVLQNPLVNEVGDILDTFVYRLGLQQRRYSFSTAAGLFKGIVAAVLLFSSDRIAKRLGERGLF